MNRQDRINLIRSYIAECEYCLIANKEIKQGNIEKLKEEFEKFVAFENDTLTVFSKQCKDAISNISMIIDNIM